LYWNGGIPGNPRAPASGEFFKAFDSQEEETIQSSIFVERPWAEGKN
jgi:hypothetical protein